MIGDWLFYFLVIGDCKIYLLVMEILEWYSLAVVFRLGSGCMLSTADGVVLWLWPDRVFVTYLSNSYICCLSV